MKVHLTIFIGLVLISAVPEARGFFGRFKQGRNGNCPPIDALPADQFDLVRYISSPWYSVKQVPFLFQPEDQLFCVRAEYEPLDPSQPLNGVSVNNYANQGQVNGPPTTTSGTGGGSFPGRFIGIPSATQPSKLDVGFALPGTNRPAFGAPYWVLAVGPEYEWAIITGGAPQTNTGNGCVADTFWLFTRLPLDEDAIAAAETKARELGLDTSVLLTVEHEGCTYDSA